MVWEISRWLCISRLRSRARSSGCGPAFTFATASHDELGQGKFDAGLSAVALSIRGPWLIGALATDVASVSGVSYRKNVHQMFVQAFINYNFRAVGTSRAPRSSPRTGKRRAVNSGPCRWAAEEGRVFRLGKQAMNIQMQAFGNVARPHDAGDWTLRVQFQLLFPK